MENKYCPSCKNENENIRVLCTFCEFPFEGTDKEKAIHIGKFINKKGVLFDANSSTIKSQRILFIIAGMNLVFLIIRILHSNVHPFDLGISLFFIILFTACAFLIQKKPLIFTNIPLLFLLFSYTIEFLISPLTFFRGIIFKVFIIGALIYSIYNLINSMKFKKKYNVK